MTIDEALARLESDLTPILEATTILGPLSESEIARYIISQYTEVPWEYVSNLHAKFNDDGSVHISLTYMPPITEAEVHLDEANG